MASGRATGSGCGFAVGLVVFMVGMATAAAQEQRCVSQCDAAAGVGVGAALERNWNGTKAEPSVHARVSLRLWYGIKLGVEYDRHGLWGDDELEREPPFDDFSREEEVGPLLYRSSHALLSLQIPLPRCTYLRPGFGIGHEARAVTGFPYETWRRSEKRWFTAGISAGYQYTFATGFGVAVEGLAVHTGEPSDGTAIFGVRLVAVAEI